MVGSGSQAGQRLQAQSCDGWGAPVQLHHTSRGARGALKVPSSWFFPGGPFLPSRSLHWVARDVFWQLR